jgi:hypothetical protein
MPAIRRGNVARPRIDAGMRGTRLCISQRFGLPGVPERGLNMAVKCEREDSA